MTPARSFANIIAKSAGAIVLSLVLLALTIKLSGGNWGLALSALYDGSLASDYSRAESLVRMTPLLLTGLGIGLAFRAGVWNIGGEGQLYMGALAVTAVAPALGHLPAVIAIPSALVLAAISGGLWAFIAAYLRTRRGVQEVISTIMLNFLALQIVSYCVHGPLRESTGQFPYSNELPPSLTLPLLNPPTRLHTGVLISIAAALIIWFLLFRTIWGFSIRAIGESPEAAEHGGFNPEKIIWKAMFASGALAGIAGAVELMGLSHILFENFSPGYGYTAIAVALLGSLHPVGIAFSALLFGVLQAGAGAMQRDAGVNEVVVLVAQCAVILAVAFQTAKTTIRQVTVKALGASEV